MLRNTVVDRFNINIVNYSDYFCNDRSIDIVNDIYDLGINHNNCDTFQKDIKRATSHHVFSSVCEFFIKYNKQLEHPVFFISKSDINSIELGNYFNNPLGDYIEDHFSLIKSLLGIKYIIYKGTFDELHNNILALDGDTIELVSELQYTKPRDLFKLRKYVEKHGLTQLKHEFFDNHRFKQVII